MPLDHEAVHSGRRALATGKDPHPFFKDHRSGDARPMLFIQTKEGILERSIIFVCKSAFIILS
jgi:hypothetical protein